ncbi:unnamed protein product [Closterium sp. NIES-54]
MRPTVALVPSLSARCASPVPSPRVRSARPVPFPRARRASLPVASCPARPVASRPSHPVPSRPLRLSIRRVVPCPSRHIAPAPSCPLAPITPPFDVHSTLIRWLLTTEGTRHRCVSCLHFDRGGLVMEIARTSMIHARAPHFLWPYAVRYAAHQLNLWPRVSWPGVSPTCLWIGSPGVASRFRVWGSLTLVRETSANKLSPRALPCVLLGFREDSSDFTFYHPPLHRFLDSRDVRFDMSVPYYTQFPYRGLPVPPPPLFQTPTPPPAPPVQPPPPGPAPSALPPQAAADPEGAGVRSADPGGATSGGVGVGAESVPARGPGAGGVGVGAEPVSAGGSSLRGADVPRAVLGGAGAPSAGPGEPGTSHVAVGGAGSRGGATSALESVGVGMREASIGAAAAGATAGGGAAAAAAVAGAATAAAGAAAAATAAAPAAAAAGAAAAAATYASCLWPLSPWSPLPFSSLLSLSSCLRSHSALTASLSTPVTDYYRTYRPILSCVLASLVTDPRASLSSVSALTATEFDATRCLDYTTRVVAAPPTSPLAVGGESTLGCDALEDRQFELEFLVAASPHLCAMLLAPEGDPDGLDIPTPRTYAEAVSGHWASQWRAAMDTEMASYRSTGTYFDEVPPPGANVVDGMWIFKPSSADPLLFDRCGSTPFFVLIYVDDLVFATVDTVALADVKSELQRRYTCTDLGELRHYLGLQITRDRAACTITPTQSHMVQQVLQWFEFQFSTAQPTPLAVDHRLIGHFPDEPFEPSGPYPELVGCLIYVMTCTRPDLAFPLSIFARFVAPGRHRLVHWTAAVRVAKYLATTSCMGMVLGGRQPVVLTGHCDSSYTDDAETHKSTQGYCFSLGSGALSWRYTRSSSVSTSTAEAEIYAGAMAAQDLHWLTFLLTDLGDGAAADSPASSSISSDATTITLQPPGREPAVGRGAEPARMRVGSPKVGAQAAAGRVAVGAVVGTATVGTAAEPGEEKSAPHLHETGGRQRNPREPRSTCHAGKANAEAKTREEVRETKALAKHGGGGADREANRRRSRKHNWGIRREEEGSDQQPLLMRQCSHHCGKFGKSTFNRCK